MSAQDIADAFIRHFYQTFDQSVDGLNGMFLPQSMLTFEGQQVMGTDAIIQKLRSIGKVAHTPKSWDVQPSVDNNAMLIFVAGTLTIEGQSNSLHFCETFQLVSKGPGEFYVHNDIFRLNYS